MSRYFIVHIHVIAYTNIACVPHTMSPIKHTYTVQCTCECDNYTFLLLVKKVLLLIVNPGLLPAHTCRLRLSEQVCTNWILHQMWSLNLKRLSLTIHPQCITFYNYEIWKWVKVTVQFERCFWLKEHISVISWRNPINLYITEKLIKFSKSLFNFSLLILNK